MSLKNFKSILNPVSVKNILSKVFILFITISFLNQSFYAYSEVFLYAPSSGKSTSQFLYEVKPGDVIKDTVEINNGGNENLNLKISTVDSYSTPEGGITSLPSNVKSEKVGTWIKTESENLNINSKGVVKLKFTASVPKDTASGEYLGVILATPVTAKKPEHPVSLDFVKSIKVYFHVKGEYKISTKAGGLNILTPSDSDFMSEKEKLPYLGKTSMVIRVNLENNGNVFSRVEGKYKIIQNGREQKSGASKFDLYPDAGGRYFYIVPSIPYLVGNTKVEFSYKTLPINFKSEDITITNGTGVLNDYVDLSQTEFNQFSPEKVKPFQTEAQRLEILNPPKEVEENVIVKKSDNLSNIIIWIMGSILILISAILITAVYIKSNKPELWIKLVKYFFDIKDMVLNYFQSIKSKLTKKLK